MSKMIGRVVGKVTHAVSGIKVEIRLRKKDLVFFAEYAGEMFQNTDSKKLHLQVWNYIEETHSLEWLPGIEVQETRPFAQNIWEQANYMGLVIARFYYAHTEDGRLRKEDWERYARSTDRAALSGRAWTWARGRGNLDRRFEPPCEWDTLSDAAHTYYLPYSEEVWQGLLELIRGLARAKLLLREIVGGSEKGMEQLAAVGAEILKMLPEAV